MVSYLKFGFALVVVYLYSNRYSPLNIAYMSSPAHVELIAEEKAEDVTKAKEENTTRFSRKQIAQGRGGKVAVGGGL